MVKREMCEVGDRCPGCPARGLAARTRKAIPMVMDAALISPIGEELSDNDLLENAHHDLVQVGSIKAANNPEAREAVSSAARRKLEFECSRYLVAYSVG